MVSFKTDGKAIMLIFFAAIIGIVFLASIADQVFLETNTIEIINVTHTGPAVNTSLDITGRELVTLVAAYNATDASDILTGRNGTIITGVSTTTGLLSVQIFLNNTDFVGQEINVSYIANPDGYISDTGARSITLLIVIFGSLAILITVVAILISEGTLGKLIGRS